MSLGEADRLCQSTGLRLLPANNQHVYRVTKDRGPGPLVGYPNSHVGPLPPDVGHDLRGRWDTMGSTVYFADTERTAFAEVLRGFRRELIKLAPLADIAGFPDAESYAQAIIDDAAANDVDQPWAVSGDWQRVRSISRVQLPATGWWVQIDRPDTMSALCDQIHNLGLGSRLNDLTSAHLASDDRVVTTTLAEYIRGLTLDDGSQPLGINFPSKSLFGRCWAWWDRRTDEGLSPGRDAPSVVQSWNVDVPAFRDIAGHYKIPVLPGRLLH